MIDWRDCSAVVDWLHCGEWIAKEDPADGQCVSQALAVGPGERSIVCEILGKGLDALNSPDKLASASPAQITTALGPNGEVILPERTERRQKLNPAYDHTKKYLPRTQRPEWDAVGLLGKLVAVDDGSCVPDGWCTVGPGGVATASKEPAKYRVMARLDENHIRIMIL